MPTHIIPYLKEHFAEPVPQWLARHAPGQRIDLGEALASRVVFYPGCGDDGQAVRVFGAAHAAHCFVLADYLTRREKMERQLDDPGFLGYRRLDRIEVTPQDLAPQGWVAHVRREEIERAHTFADPHNGYAFIDILQRQDHFDDEHGPARIAVAILGADGIAAYDALFCQAGRERAPFAVLLQDHGFGGNYDRFGAGGLMERIAGRTGVFPRFLLVGDHNTPAWSGYQRIDGLHVDIGGGHRNRRSLYHRP